MLAEGDCGGVSTRKKGRRCDVKCVAVNENEESKREGQRLALGV